MKRKPWTTEEDQLLKDRWGNISVQSICKHLGRTYSAVKRRVYLLGLPPFLESGDYLSMNRLLHAITGQPKANKRKYLKAGFPAERKLVYRKRFYVTTIDRFWQWAETHQELIDWQRFLPLSIGEEPRWVRQARERAKRKVHRMCWNEAAIRRLRQMAAVGYTLVETANVLGCSSQAVSKEALVLGCRFRKIGRKRFSREELIELETMLQEGSSLTEAAKALGRTYSSVYRKRKRMEEKRRETEHEKDI